MRFRSNTWSIVLPVIAVSSLLGFESPLRAGVAYSDPTGGWTYVFQGNAAANAAAAALDGTWDHDNASDSWDGSEIGQGKGVAGGISALVEAGTGVTFVRLQDPGDPRDYGASDPSNRKILLDRDIIGRDGLSETFLDDGFTFSFRARLATTATGPLDRWLPDGGTAGDWPAEGFGYTIHDNATSNFSFYQPDGQAALGFSLATPRETPVIEGTGLLMNDTVADFPQSIATGDGEPNLLEIPTLTDWHEFWITIERIEGGDGTHQIDVYLDGSTTPETFVVTAGTRADLGDDGKLSQGPMSMGLGATPREGAFDLDFIAYIPGVFVPKPGGGMTGDYNSNQQLDAGDLDLQADVMVSPPNPLPAGFDLNNDNAVDMADRKVWLHDLRKTWVGDSSLDGLFTSADFVLAFQAGKYEVQGAKATWVQGDWDGDQLFTSADFVAAFADGGYEAGLRPANVSAVPEPSAVCLMLLGLSLLPRRRW